MAKGKKTGGGSRKGIPNRATTDVRQAFASLLQGKAHELDGWLTKVGRHDPARAIEIVIKLAEYHIPKLSRTEIANAGNQPFVVQTVRGDERV